MCLCPCELSPFPFCFPSMHSVTHNAPVLKGLFEGVLRSFSVPQLTPLCVGAPSLQKPTPHLTFAKFYCPQTVLIIEPQGPLTRGSHCEGLSFPSPLDASLAYQLHLGRDLGLFSSLLQSLPQAVSCRLEGLNISVHETD